MKPGFLRGSAGGFAFTAVACGTPTQIELRLDTDVPCSALTGFTIAAGAPGEVETRAASTEATLCNDGRLGALVLVPSAERDARLALKVVAAQGLDVSECVAPDYGKNAVGGGCIVARRELRFIPHTSLILPVTLRESCLNVPCDSSTTCVAGACVPALLKDPSVCVGERACTEQILGGGGGGAGGAAPGSPKRVFVTSKAYDGALGGLSGADAKCQALADAAMLGGTFKAWLSTEAESPSLRFTKQGPWTLVDGTLLADDWAQLTSGTLKNAISRDEQGMPVGTTSACSATKYAVWSQTNPDGTFAHANEADPSSPRFDCSNWTGTNGQDAIQWGDASATDAHWTVHANCNTFGVACLGKLARLYCFEQ